MSISTEIARLQQAKSDLATSITNKGVTVPAATTLDGYAALVDQIQQGGGTLPYDAEIEYLESSGTQYIDTGILFSIGVTVLINAICVSNYSSTQIIAAPSPDGGCWLGSGSQNGGTFGPGTIGRSNTRTSMIMNYCEGKTLIMGNGNTVSNTRSTNPTTSSIHLFGCNGQYMASARIYSCQIFDSDFNCLADFIPVRRGSTGYLYDKVSKQLFGNIGSGSFIIGPDKGNTLYDAKVEYIQSTGTQWIDTGIVEGGTVNIYGMYANKGSGSAGFWGIYNGSTYLEQQHNGFYYSGNTGLTYNMPSSLTKIEVRGTDVYVNDSKKGTITRGTHTTSYTIPLFCLKNASGNTIWLSQMQLAYFKIIKNDVLVRDFIPVRVGQVGYLYDNISNTLFGNQGTGSFTLGPDVT